MNTAPDLGWEFLLTEVGRTRLREVEEFRSRGESAERVNKHFRKRGEEPGVVAALLTQADLRLSATQKFGEVARSMLFTKAGLEQASRRIVAELHAQRYVDAGVRHVTDMGCGIGSESMAFLRSGINVRAIEIDPFTAQLAKHNLAQVDTTATAEVVTGDVETIPPPVSGGVFLDPARRTAGHRNTQRLTSPDDYSPSLDFAFHLAETLPTGLKLGPGFPRDLIPKKAEAQWVSVDGQLVEMGLWFGACARPEVTRSALIITDSATSQPMTNELASAGDAPDVTTRPLGEYIYEPNGAVIRARLIGLLAEQIGAGMLSAGIAYLTSDHPVNTPFAQGFRIIDEVSVREKDLKRELAQRGIGKLEIKKRGVGVDPASLRQRLRLKGPRSATLILTRVGNKHVAYLAERFSL